MSIRDDEPEVCSDPEDGVEIVDIQEIKRMDWMAPETLSKETQRKAVRVKREKYTTSKGGFLIILVVRKLLIILRLFSREG